VRHGQAPLLHTCIIYRTCYHVIESPLSDWYSSTVEVRSWSTSGVDIGSDSAIIRVSWPTKHSSLAQQCTDIQHCQTLGSRYREISSQLQDAALYLRDWQVAVTISATCTTAPIQPGSSGSPYCCPAGEVVGMVTGQFNHEQAQTWIHVVKFQLLSASSAGNESRSRNRQPTFTLNSKVCHYQHHSSANKAAARYGCSVVRADG
jgi:hypothetical protein